MTGPQLLQIVIAPLMLLLLWQSPPGEDLYPISHHVILLKNDCASSFQYFHFVRGAWFWYPLCGSWRVFLLLCDSPRCGAGMSSPV